MILKLIQICFFICFINQSDNPQILTSLFPSLTIPPLHRRVRLVGLSIFVLLAVLLLRSTILLLDVLFCRRRLGRIRRPRRALFIPLAVVDGRILLLQLLVVQVLVRVGGNLRLRVGSDVGV
uniref:(northern house mosquito) hypothetical protein n=1 Tax=Culex pipiens TaxID=7175 RepID=A0A8D8EWE2_CULPI